MSPKVAERANKVLKELEEKTKLSNDELEKDRREAGYIRRYAYN